MHVYWKQCMRNVLETHNSSFWYFRLLTLDEIVNVHDYCMEVQTKSITTNLWKTEHAGSYIYNNYKILQSMYSQEEFSSFLPVKIWKLFTFQQNIL